MSVTVLTSYVYNVRIAMTVINNDVEDVKDKWIGDNNSDAEKISINYIKQELKL